MKVFYTNAQSIVNKVAKLQLELANSQADIVVLTEIHLDCSISSEEVIGSDYTVYRKDRTGNGVRHGGGVLIVAKKGLITSIREHHDLPSELLFVDIITDSKKKLTIGTFYRPPNSDLKPLEDLRSCLSSITTTDLLVTGDFNLSEFDWSTNHPTKSSEHHYLLSDIIQDNFLYQMVDESTRENNILDLVLTTNSDLINNLEVGEPFSDHNSITFIVNTRPYQQRISTKENYAFNKADWNHLRSLFSYSPWYFTLEQQDINANWEVWKDLYFAAVNESILKYRHKRKDIAPWITKDLIKLSRKKKHLYKKAKKSNSEDH